MNSHIIVDEEFEILAIKLFVVPQERFTIVLPQSVIIKL